MIEPTIFHRDLEALLELEPGTIKGDESLRDLYWDSMTVVMFIAMADQNYSKAVSPAKLAMAEEVPDLLALVQAEA